MAKEINNYFTKSENNFLKSHGTPERIQKLLDSLEYRCESKHLPAIYALRDWKAHCFDGCLLAAAALRRRGYTPFIIDLCAEHDDDHLICAYKSKGAWGAVAKSNFPGLRSREPIYKSPRELALSYFELYFNFRGEKSLRNFSKPFALPSLKKLDWETDLKAISPLLDKLEITPHYSLLTQVQMKNLAPISNQLMRSQMLDVELKGARGNFRKINIKKIVKPKFIKI